MTISPYQVMPPLSADEREALKADIALRGVMVPVEYDEQNNVLDGHHRIELCGELGITAWPRLVRYGLSEEEKRRHARRLNLDRRHLNAEQKRELIEAELREAPQASDRKIAAGLGVHHTTVGTVREGLESTGEISQLDKREGRDGKTRRIVQFVPSTPEEEEGLSISAKALRLRDQGGPVHGARSIMGSRQEPNDSLDYFPTPPWATRALVERVFPRIGIAKLGSVWEPACGEGHIAEVLREYTADVHATDIFDYGYGTGNIDFLDPGMDAWRADWIITNPPFGDRAEQFVLEALKCVNVGVAMFMRLQWLESIGRCERIFQPHPPTIVAQFAERVPLHKGRYDPEGGTATAYLWIVWMPYRVGDGRTELFWIPKCRPELTHDDDAQRFTAHPVISKPRPVDATGAPVTHDGDGQIVESDSDGIIIPRFAQSIAHGKSHSEQGGAPE